MRFGLRATSRAEDNGLVEIEMSGKRIIDGPNDVLAGRVTVVVPPSAPAPPIADDAALVETMAKAGAEAARKFNSAIIPWAEMTEYQRETLRRCHAAALSVVRPAIESAARAKALGDAAERYTAGLMGDEWDVFDKARDAILALKDRA